MTEDELTEDERTVIHLYGFLVKGRRTVVGWDASGRMLSLARQAVQACDARKHEDIRAWAERLARDVGHATD